MGSARPSCWRLVAGQDVEPAEGSDGTDGRWRIARRVAPDRVISTVDPDARHAHKSRQKKVDGFQAHIVIEPDTGLTTAVALTKAAGPGNSDAARGMELLTADAAQPGGGWRVHRRRLHHRRDLEDRDVSRGHRPANQRQRTRQFWWFLHDLPTHEPLHDSEDRAKTCHSPERPAPPRTPRPGAGPRVPSACIAGTDPWSNAPSRG